MTKNLTPIIEANDKYSKEFDKGDLSAQPKKNIAILTCMDARFDLISNILKSNLI